MKCLQTPRVARAILSIVTGTSACQQSVEWRCGISTSLRHLFAISSRRHLFAEELHNVVACITCITCIN
jgi:hypothetical protein